MIRWRFVEIFTFNYSNPLKYEDTNNGMWIFSSVQQAEKQNMLTVQQTSTIMEKWG